MVVNSRSEPDSGCARASHLLAVEKISSRVKMKRVAFALFGVAGILVLVLASRTIALRSRQIAAEAAVALRFERSRAVERLSRAIQFRTVSHRDPARSSSAEFARLRDFLRDAFPLVHAQLEREVVGAHSLLYAWRGADSALKPMLLMAHMDVVPADEQGWRHSPFSGALADGYVWGRGAMDDKASVLGILEAVELLLAENFKPKRTVYLAFGHDEEIGGELGARRIAGLLRARGVSLDVVLDEGLSIMTGMIPGIAAPVALVGMAEKGYLSLRLTAQTPPGHSSVPPAESAIALLSRAIGRLDQNPFPSRLAGASRAMLEFLAPEMPWGHRLVLANLWLFDPLVRRQLSQSPLTNALIRTTLAPTILQAGIAENVLPSEAAATVNLRLLPGDSIAAATERVRRTIADPRIAVAPLAVRSEASAVADPDVAAFQAVSRTIRQIAPDAVVAPGLLVAATDSRHYAALARTIFRFLPIRLGPDDVKRYHGIDERISFEDYERCVRFYAQLIRNFQS